MADGLSADQRAVLEVIDREQRTFWTGDWDGYLTCFLHAPFIQRWGSSLEGGMYRRRGWEELKQRARRTMDLLPAATRAFAEVPMRNVDVRVAGDMAWATYERQYARLPGIEDNWPNGVMQSLRVLERHKGAWRIVLAVTFDPGLGTGPVVHVSPQGEVLWRSTEAAEKLAQSDDFIIRGGRLRLRDRRSDARLQEAIRWATDVDRNVIGLRGARPVLLERASGPTRVVWVLVDAGAILVVLEDTRPARRRLDYAADVFRLSPAQVALAAAIIDDRALSDFAVEQRITLNTARTHLRRLFDKVGVHSQPTLVRVLLSLSAPR